MAEQKQIQKKIRFALSSQTSKENLSFAYAYVAIGGPIQCVVSYRDQYAHFIIYYINILRLATLLQ